VLLAVGDDPLGRHWTDAGQPIELCHGRHVQVHTRRGRTGEVGDRRQNRVEPLRHHDLLAVGQPCRQIQAIDVAVERRTAGRLEGVVDARADRQAVDTGCDHLAAEVHHQQGRDQRRRGRAR
jgi:hypothetical protein